LYFIKQFVGLVATISGLLFFVSIPLAITYYMNNYRRINAWFVLIELVLFLTFIVSACLHGSVLLDPKWQIAIRIAPKVDEYIEKNPQTLLAPENVINFAEDTVMVIVDKIHDLVQKPNGR
jgi:hypothetical protein